MNNVWSSIKGLISKIAPTVAGAIGGPGAATAVNGLCSILGLNPESDADTVEAAIKKAGPDFWLKLKEFELEYAKLDIKTTELLNQDRESARKREIDLAQSGQRDYTPMLLSIIITFGFFGILILLIFYNINQSVKDIIQIMLGFLGGAFSATVQYYLGSSKGSNDKTKIMGALVSNR